MQHRVFLERSVANVLFCRAMIVCPVGVYRPTVGGLGRGANAYDWVEPGEMALMYFLHGFTVWLHCVIRNPNSTSSSAHVQPIACLEKAFFNVVGPRTSFSWG